MTKTTIALTILLLAAPALGSAQQRQQPPVPPQRGQMVRPGQAPQMQRWAQPRFQRQMLRGQFQGQMRGQFQGGRFAPQAQGRGFIQGRGVQPRFAPNARGPIGPMMLAEGPDLLALRQQLGLSEDQVKRLQTIRDEARTANMQQAEQLRAERQKLMEEQREAWRERTEQQRARQDAMHERIKQVLTPEQQQKLDELRQRQRGMMQRRGLQQ